MKKMLTQPPLRRWEPAERPRDAGHGKSVTHKGIPGLPTQDHWWDQRWRWLWPSLSIEIADGGSSAYHVIFDTDKKCRRTIRPVSTPQCNVQIGPEEVTFYAVCASTGIPLPVRWVSNRLATRI